MVAATLDAQKLTLSVLDVEEETASASTLGEFRAGKPLVLDFWHTRCVKCPAAMAMLDAHAKAHPEIVFAACALSLGWWAWQWDCDSCISIFSGARRLERRDCSTCGARYILEPGRFAFIASRTARGTLSVYSQAVEVGGRESRLWIDRYELWSWRCVQTPEV